MINVCVCVCVSTHVSMCMYVREIEKYQDPVNK